ncbi:MAG: HAMP domain-containing sensor histidine kinase [Rhodoglobus sp.]
MIVVRRALAPVDQMRRQVDAVTGRNLDHRVDDQGSNDEIGRLARTMNAMLDRLDRSQQAQRQFISDASHELKSPLASLRQYAEVADVHPERFTAAELAEAILDEGGRLERLVQGMLVLARADERALTPDPVAVDLDDPVLAEAARVRATTALTVDVSAVSPARVMGDAGLLAQVARNLVDNATRHAEHGLRLSLSADEHEVVLLVDDDGGGIAVEDRERVFERFLRLDDARSREAGGSGLGLAIVREIVTAHGGTVRVDDSPSGGARFEVRMPAASDF